MFGIFKRKQMVISGMDEVQQQQEKFDALMKEHRVQFNKAMESRKKASKLMRETLDFIMSLVMSQQNPTQYEEAKKNLISCLLAVQDDEALKQNV